MSMSPLGRTRTPAADRFHIKYICMLECRCMIWTAASIKSFKVRYGQFFPGDPDKPRLTMAHRFAWELVHGPIPDGMTIDHTCTRGTCECHHTLCVNPDHMELATPRENVLRGDTTPGRNSRKTHCPEGHPLSGDNLYVKPNGQRNCRACRPIVKRAWRAKNPGRG